MMHGTTNIKLILSRRQTKAKHIHNSFQWKCWWGHLLPPVSYFGTPDRETLIWNNVPLYKSFTKFEGMKS